MKRILFYIRIALPKRFTRKQYNVIIREYSNTTHPEHYLQRLVEMEKIQHIGSGLYSW